MAPAVRHTVKLGPQERAHKEAGAQGLPFPKGSLVVETTGSMGKETHKLRKAIVEMEADQHQGHPRADGSKVVSKQILIVLAANFLDVTCLDARRIHSSVDMDLPEGLRANTVSYCQASLNV